MRLRSSHERVSARISGFASAAKRSLRTPADQKIRCSSRQSLPTASPYAITGLNWCAKRRASVTSLVSAGRNFSGYATGHEAPLNSRSQRRGKTVDRRHLRIDVAGFETGDGRLRCVHFRGQPSLRYPAPGALPGEGTEEFPATVGGLHQLWKSRILFGALGDQLVEEIVIGLWPLRCHASSSPLISRTRYQV